MIYHYETEDGRRATHEQPLSHPAPPPASVVLEDGTVAKRVWGASVPPTAGWPLECEGSGVLPEQAGELRQEFKRLGLKVEVSPRGNPIYTSAQHRREALKARGFFDRSGYT